ncbi:MAG: peptidase [Acidobacteria bacterium]|nr:peptidase [Acidobacteriota bacterium]
MRRLCGIAAVFIAAMALGQTGPTTGQIATRTDPKGLKADVSFLASDALEGRATPSRGLDIAAEYIAAQFRRAGLEPAGDDGYFQTAPYIQTKPVTEGLELTLTIGGRTFAVDKSAIIVLRPGLLNVENEDALIPPPSEGTAPVVVTPGGAQLPSARYDGKIVLADLRSPLASGGSKAKLSIFYNAPSGAFQPPIFGLSEALAPQPATGPALLVTDADVNSALQEAKDGTVSVSARIPGSSEEPVKLRNVIGVLRGSDSALREEYLAVSAHYDGIGIGANPQGDNIFNGANDNASGSAGVIAIANAISARTSRPKRSVVFLAFFGEERGMLGSRYYVRHPVFPVSKTIAQINLEQIGRTDSRQGPRLLQLNLTGHDYTTLPGFFEQPSKETGVQVVKDAANTGFFAASDNISFAEAGVPSTSVSVTYLFPDSHAPDDEWPKLDYENMARVTSTVTAAVIRLADSDETPRWNAENPRALRYIKAREGAGMK